MDVLENRGHVVFDWDGTIATVHSDRRYHLYSGIRELMQKLSESGYILYLWTARERYSMTKILDELTLRSFFSEISTPTDHASKPSTEGLQAMLAGVSKKKIVVIGDSYADMIGAKNFGAWALGAGWNQAINRDVLKEFGVDFIVETPEEALEKIEALVKD